jgi:hypothetical protein
VGVSAFMIPSGEWMNPTRAVGLVAYGTATFCCGIAWMRARSQRRDWRLAALLMLIESTLLLDIVFNVRWMLHAWINGVAMRAHEYDMRRVPQQIAITVLVGLLIVGWISAFWRLRGRIGLLLAVSGLLLSLIVWCVEVVSLHVVDQVFYHTLGGVMVVSLLWGVACMMASIGILLDPCRDFGGRPTGATGRLLNR